MAAKFSSACDVPLRPKKGHDMAWSCDEHGEPIKFYCKEHKIAICHPCAIKDHQKPCHLDNIGDVILKMGSELEDRLLEIEEILQRSKTLNSEIESYSTSMDNHLKTVDDEVNIAFKHKIKSVQDKEREEILLINEEADDKIRIISDQLRIINESRERRIKLIREKSKTNQQSLVDTQVQLTADTKDIGTTVGEKIEELKGKNQHNINTMDNIGSKMKRIRQDDKALVNGAHQVITSLDERVSENVYQDILDSLDHLKLEVQRVKFVEGKIGGDDYARIYGYIGKWEILKSIDIPPIVQIPCILGFISNNEVCVSDLNTKDNKLYITNISSGQTRSFLTGANSTNITLCAIVDTNLIVICGKWKSFTTGDSLNGCIALYDRQWKHVRNIAIPKNKSKFGISPIVLVDVDKDGLILAAEVGQSYIYVINPTDGKIVNVITMQGKIVRGVIQALSSGDVLVKTEKDEFTVISRSGEQKSVIHHHLHGSGKAYCRVDKLTNTLYIIDWDKKNGKDTIDQVSCDDDNKARRIVEYKHTDCSRVVNPCAVSPSGNIIASTGTSLLVYKNKFVV